MHSNMQLYSAPKLESLIGVRISQYCSVDMNEAGTEKNLLWMHGVVTRVSDGTFLFNANAQTNCWGAGKVAEVDWDACEKANYLAGKCIVELRKRCGTRTRREPGASSLERLTMASRALNLMCAFVITANN